MKRYQFADGNNLIKNDCSVDIPRYLTLNWLCDSEIELPSKQSSAVTEFIKENLNLNNENKPIPLATKEPNQQQQNRNQSSGLKNSLFSSQKSSVHNSFNPPKHRRNIFDTKADFKNDSCYSYGSVDDNSEPLPLLEIPKIPIFDGMSNIYDEKKFVLKDMSEEEQLKLAISKSLEPPVLDDGFEDDMDFFTSNEKFKPLNKSKVDEENLQFIDGNFDFDADFVLKRHDYSMMMLKIDRMKTIDTTVDQTSQQTQQDMHIGSHIVPEKRRTKLI